MIFTILHILNPSRRHIDALSWSTSTRPRRLGLHHRPDQQRSVPPMALVPTGLLRTGTDASTKAYDTAANRNRVATKCCYER